MRNVYFNIVRIIRTLQYIYLWLFTSSYRYNFVHIPPRIFLESSGNEGLTLLVQRIALIILLDNDRFAPIRRTRPFHSIPFLSLSKYSFRNGKLWRKIDVVSLQKVSTQPDILRVPRRTNVTREVSLSAAFEFHVCG